MSGDADPYSKYRSQHATQVRECHTISANRRNSFYMEKTVDLAGEGRKGGLSCIQLEARAQLAISVIHSLIRRDTGLCAKDTDTVTHIGAHTVSSQNKSVTKSELGLNQSVTLS